MQNDQNDTEKFYDTYGKNVSFESFPEEPGTSFKQEQTPTPPITAINQAKKYLTIALFLTIAITMAFIGGIFILIFLGVMVIGMVIRSIFFKSNGSTNSSFIVIKK